MRRLVFLALTLLAWAAAAHAGGTRFRWVDLVVDPGAQPLAAYQVELTFDRSVSSLVGIEGGEGPFREPPFYDPRGLTAGRVVIAAFTLEPDPPRGSVRVARVHLEEQGESRLEVRLMVAGTVGGENIAATVKVTRTEGGAR